MSKQADKDGDGRGTMYYVLALDHTPAVVVMWTVDKEQAEQMRADYERVHGGKVIITTK